jgi:hypothetical protein
MARFQGMLAPWAAPGVAPLSPEASASKEEHVAARMRYLWPPPDLPRRCVVT